MKIKAILGKLIDPHGPIGAILSPSDVYKERAGLPISSPHTLRHVAESRPAFVEHALAPARFVSEAQAVVPKDRVRLLSQYIEERWSPVYATPEQYWQAPTRTGWRVTQHARETHCDCEHASFTVGEDGQLRHMTCGRAAKQMGEHAKDFREHALSIGIAQPDENYNTYYPTIRGNDPIQVGNRVVSGGTRITGGRAQYNRLTKNMVHWDSGTMRERAKAEHGEKVKQYEAVKQHTEAAIKSMPSKFVEKPTSQMMKRAQGVAP